MFPTNCKSKVGISPSREVCKYANLTHSWLQNQKKRKGSRLYRAFSCDVTNFAGNLDRHVGVPWDNSISIMAASPLSDYANNLDPHVKKRYCEKISCVGIDPILIPEKTYDPDCLPRVESMDLLSFLVLETSYYRKDQFKAF